MPQTVFSILPHRSPGDVKKRRGAAMLTAALATLLPAGLQAEEVISVDSGAVESVTTDVTPSMNLAGGSLFPHGGIPNLETPRVLPSGFTVDFGAGVMYDDNIYRVSDNKESATALQADGGITWARDQSGILSTQLSYRAQASTYLDLDGQDGVDQFVEAGASVNLPRTNFIFSGAYGYVTGANQPFRSGGGSRFGPEQETVDEEDREVGPLENRQTLDLSFEISRKVAERTGITAGVSYSLDKYEEEDRQGRKDLTGRLATDYAVTDFTKVGLAGEITLQNADGTGEVTTERILLTAGRTVNDRVEFNGEAGISFRQYGGSDAVEDDMGFVFRLNYSQRIGDRAAFNLSAFRDISGSATTRAASVERTGITASLSRQLTQRMSLGLQGGFDFSDYGSTKTTVDVDREETLWRGGVNLSYAPTARTSLSVYYSYRNQDSGSEGGGLSYDSNQIGFRAGISF